MKFLCKFLYLSLFVLLKFQLAHAQINDFFKGPQAMSIDLGMSSNILITDQSENAFGMGLGHQFSYAHNFALDKDKGFKLRVEKVHLREENLFKTETTESSNNYLRATEQNWLLLGLGMEFRNKTNLVDWFYEANLGYAFGMKSKIETQDHSIDTDYMESDEKTRSYMYGVLGLGIKKQFRKKLWMVTSLRWFSLLYGNYGDDLKGRTFMAVSMMASVGLEYRF